ARKVSRVTPFHQRLSAVTRRMADDMLVRNLSISTIDSYTYHVARFENFLKDLGKHPAEAGPDEIRTFQLYLIEVRKVSWSSFNQAICGLRFLYRYTLPRDWHVAMIPFGKKPKVLPAVLSQQEVERLFQCTANLKHRTLLMTLYAAGLRLSEGSGLRIPDIDSQRMMLSVRHGKGNKDRLVPMSPRLLQVLRDYWKAERPSNYLFPGKHPDRPISGTSIQKAFKMAALKADIKKEVVPHTLRHSYATGLLEAGVDRLTIGRLLGHKSFTRTMIYLHVRQPHLESTPSPIDWLPVRQLPGWANKPDDQKHSNQDDQA
ncbi:MAG: site-specific integrase, partial [Pirellulales bacterium]|nr:site-specific integrase [Pirellulales bacterium]